METFYNIKNTIVQNSLSIIEKNLTVGNDDPLDSLVIHKHFHNSGKLSYDAFKRSCVYLCSKNKLWTLKIEDDLTYVVFKDAIITSDDADLFIKEPEDKVVDEFIDCEDEDWSSLEVEGGSLNKVLISYDIYIFYDKYYTVPRFYIKAYENGNSIDNNRLYDFFIDEYKNRTITKEHHDKLLGCISIHPCKHAETMKRLIKEETMVEEYLIYFINILCSIIPVSIS